MTKPGMTRPNAYISVAICGCVALWTAAQATHAHVEHGKHLGEVGCETVADDGGGLQVVPGDLLPEDGPQVLALELGQLDLQRQ